MFFSVEQGILVETLPVSYRDEIRGLSKASGLNLGKLVDFVI